ncbi:hypothetical protein QFC20_004033 [Naganishia adeliensis]|uniref:Uncharacterized protein n=1 Tax=Naganishia adeliensis TaxID=92952 RepID=A0ACC2W502_9TREE|nr:hypothetical protein QFC20_004033 [Naganishia adeliensis]
MTRSVSVAKTTVPAGLYIGGTWFDGRGPLLETVNPATEQVIASITTASEGDIDNAVSAARECFETNWGTNTSGQVRGKLMLALADALERENERIAKVESEDSGKPLAWCKVDNEDAVACYRYYAGLADKIHGTTIELDDQEKKIAPALAAGCTIVFKAAESTPLATLLFAEIFDTVGYGDLGSILPPTSIPAVADSPLLRFPAGTFNHVSGLGATVGNALSRHMDIDKIAFTGSTATGRHILKAAAETNLKGVTLELGGKSANIVFEDAKLEDAAKWAAFGVFENMGQSCSAGSRILVQEGVYDKFIELFVKETQAIKVGDPAKHDTFQGPQANKVQFEKILGYIKAGKEEGGRLVTGDVTMDMKIAKEEIFGPVACVIKFKTEEETIKLANGTEYGLAAAVHTNDE